jgi:uncharacterized damage-inducible protein DinB
MALKEMLLSEFDREVATTRQFLERLPAEDAGWRPHPKSATLGGLAVHLATIPWWLEVTLTTSELDLDPPGGGGPPAPPAFTTVAALLAYFERNAAAGRTALARAADADLSLPWTLKSAGATVFSLPRAAVVRSFCLSHFIHHRAQLGVYLRLRDVPLPSCYGPTADTGT